MEQPTAHCTLPTALCTLHTVLQVADSLDVYTKAFQTLKGNRTLVWKQHLGFANIDLEIGDKKINLTVSPIHAAIIYRSAHSGASRTHPLCVCVALL